MNAKARVTGLVVAIALAMATGAGLASAQPGAQPEAPGAAVPSAATYLEKAAMADLFEIRAGQTVLNRVRHLDVRQHARAMVERHQQASAYLKHAARLSDTPSSEPRLDSEHARKLEALTTASPDVVDRLYLQTQIEAHERALALHRAYARHGTDPALRQAASEMAVLVEHHLAHAERMASNLLASAR